ncbi:MAG: hypothetical protein ACRDQF_10210 [Thermocrispum sp.]
MAGGHSRTRLEQLLRQRNLTLRDLRRMYQDKSGDALSERQAYRWIAGEVVSMPHARAQDFLGELFGEPAERLLGPPFGTPAPLPAVAVTPARGSSRPDWHGQVVATSADRARKFLTRAEATNVGNETMDQLTDDIRRLVGASSQQALPELLTDVAGAQDQAFTLLEGRQKPDQTRDLYLLAGVASGLMAKAAHDLAGPHDALTQARTAYACADNAGHDGLRAWVRGLQSLIAYWSGRFDDSVRYARLGADPATRTNGTAVAWLACAEARALGALNRMEEAQVAINRATDSRDSMQPDELDQMGGICTFGHARQLYYSADALAWGGAEEAAETERLATAALNAYATGPDTDRAFGDEHGARCDVAIARVSRCEHEGAAEILAPVFELPAVQRIRGIQMSVDNVRRQLVRAAQPSSVSGELLGVIEGFSATRPALPR